jgi:hypothetical protein
VCDHPSWYLHFDSAHHADSQPLRGETPLRLEAVGKTPGEPAGSRLGVGSEIGHLMRRGMSVRPDAVAHSRPDNQLCERRAAFRRRLFPTAFDGSRSEAQADRAPADFPNSSLPGGGSPATGRSCGAALVAALLTGSGLTQGS